MSRVSFGGAEITSVPGRSSLKRSGSQSPKSAGEGSPGSSTFEDALVMDDLVAALDRRTDEMSKLQQLLDEAHSREAELRVQATANGAAWEPEASPSSASSPNRSNPGEETVEELDEETTRMLSTPEGRTAVAGVVHHLRARLKAVAHKDYGGDWGRLFRNQDIDRSGQIDWDEFVKLCRKILGQNVRDSHLRILFRSVDNDRSGELSMEELVAFMDDPVERMRTRLREALREKHGGNPKKLFKLADKDKSGGLEWEEFRKLVHSTLGLVDDDVQLTTVYRTLDSDGSGKVSVEELAVFLAEPNQLIIVPLRVSIVGARGLVNSTAAKNEYTAGRTRIDPYCICEIQSRPGEKVATKALNSQKDPQWKHSGEFAEYAVGESLLFSVWHRNLMSQDILIGRVKLPCAMFLENGFNSELQLWETGKGIKSYVKVKVDKLDMKGAATRNKGKISSLSAFESIPDDDAPLGKDRSSFVGGERSRKSNRSDSLEGNPVMLERSAKEASGLREEVDRLRAALLQPGTGVTDETLRDELRRMAKELRKSLEACKKAEEGLQSVTRQKEKVEKLARQMIKENRDESKQAIKDAQKQAAQANAYVGVLKAALEEQGLAVPEPPESFEAPPLASSVGSTSSSPAISGQTSDLEVSELQQEVTRLTKLVQQLSSQGHGHGHHHRHEAASHSETTGEGHDFCHEKEEALLGASKRAFNDATAARTQVAELECEIATLRLQVTPEDSLWRRFTPARLNIQRCYARTWANGLGGQCAKRKIAGSEYCESHQTEDSRADLGTVEGPIPQQKLQQFLRSAEKQLE